MEETLRHEETTMEETAEDTMEETAEDTMEETAEDGMEDKRMDSGMMSMKMAFDDATPLCLSPDTAEILTERGIDLTLFSTLHDTMVEKYDTMTMKDDPWTMPWKMMPCQTMPWKMMPCQTMPWKMMPCQTMPWKTIHRCCNCNNNGNIIDNLIMLGTGKCYSVCV